MKSKAIFLLAVCTSFISYASGSSSSSSSSLALRLPTSVQIAQEAEELLEASLEETGRLRKCIKNIKEKLKGANSTEKELLIPLLNNLRVNWARILLAKLIDGSKQLFDEIVECILHIGGTLQYDLEAMQQAWGSKNTFGRKGKSVELTLEQRQQEIDALKEEEKVWEERTLLVDKEIIASPEPLTKELVVQDDQKHPEFVKVQAHLHRIDELLNSCKEIARKIVYPDENDDDDESVDGAEEDSRAAKLHAIDEHFEQIRSELRKSILSTLERRLDQVNVDDLNKEFVRLLAALPHTISAAQHAVSKYLVTLERIKKNRSAYSEYRLHASRRSDIEHGLAHQDHEQHRLLRARLKLFALAERHEAAEESTPLEADELTLLENNKAVLSKREKAALAKKNGGLLSSFFS